GGTMTSRFLPSILAFLLASTARAQSSQDTVAQIRNLTPRALRTARFQLDAEQDISISAVGGPPRGRSAMRKFLDHGFFPAKEDQLWDPKAWPAKAWIMDAKTRKIVWELRTAAGATSPDGLREFDGQVRLP